MDILGNKMFSYIDKASELTQDMVNQYNTSLIVLGDEKQIFVPVINSYVGIGQSAYNYVLSKLRSTDDNFEEYNKYIHNDTVTSIFAQYSPEEIEYVFDHDSSQNPTVTINGTPYSERGVAQYITKANKNVVIKGSNAYTALNGNSNINSNVQSGISVSISHTGQLKTGNYELNGQIYSYTYFDPPYDTITVDDTKTWSYITASNTYLVDFVTKFSTQQANRVYRNLLGEDDVFIEKTFDEAFNYDSGINQLVEFEPVYVKFNHDINESPYAQVTVENTNNGYRITVNDEYNTYIIYSTIPGDIIATISDILASEDDGGYISTTNNDIPVWYHKEDEGTKREPNIADGIQTLKEVAYILDKITDGKDDDSISLAYNIAQNYRDIKDLQDWKKQIGNETVSSFTSESDTDLLTVHYYSMDKYNDGDPQTDAGAVGKVKLDLALTLAQTYIVDGVTYAAYLVSGQVPDNYNTTYFVKHEDITNLDNYILLSNDVNYDNLKKLLSEQDPSIKPNTDITLWKFNDDGTREQHGTVSFKDLGPIASVYIYFPYSKANYVFNTGLTDVKWVTTYVGWTAYNISNRINEINNDLTKAINNYIKGLDVQDYSYSYLGQFVTKVEEIDGRIIVTKEKLPLDTIIKNDINTTAETFVHISVAEAKKLGVNNIYIYDSSSNKYVTAPNIELDSFDDNDCSRFYRKITLSDMNIVPIDTTVNTLLTNAGNCTYFYKKSISNIDNYLPLDIQGENKTGGILENGKVNHEDEVYYLNLHQLTNTNTKYFDVSTVHQKNGSTTTVFTSYITPIAAATPNNTGLVDAYDVRRTIESMFKWVNIKTNTVIE